MQRSLFTIAQRNISTLNRFGGVSRSNISSIPQSTLATVGFNKPTLLTQSNRFAPTSKGWNKKSRQSQINAKQTKISRQRYHNTDFGSAFPTMTLAKFKCLPRPLFIESEVLDMFIPAPQYERAATRTALNTAQQAAQRPY
jgi:hypothetical protein